MLVIFLLSQCRVVSWNILSPSVSSDDDVLDSVHERLTVNAAGMHGAEEVSCFVHMFTTLTS